MWQLDPRFHTPGWAERRLKELGLPSKSEQDYVYIVEATASNGDASCSVSETPIQGLSPVIWPEQPKHDGHLDKDEKVLLRAHYDEVYSGAKQDYIRGVRLSDEHGYTPLTSAQALSLLAWLKQEQDTLEKLAEEQEHG